jgi:hypothetical protein
MELKAKRKYKTKNEKEIDATFEELATIGKTMVDKDLFENKAQSLRELMEEEATKAPPCKIEKKKKKDGVEPAKLWFKERLLPSLFKTREELRQVWAH